MANRKRLERKITLGRDSEGRLVRRSIYAHTKPELEKKIFEARQAYLQSCTEKPTDKITFVAFAWRWYNQEKAQKSFYTRQWYSNIIKNYFEPNLNGLYFQELGLVDFQNLINSAWQYPVICGAIKKTLGQIYAAAEDSDILTGKAPNFRRLTLPKKYKRERRALTKNEKDALFSADLNDKEKAFVFLLYYTGMRREEILALEPSCFDFRRKFVTVRQTVTFTHGQTLLEKSAKNYYSLRSIPLPGPCVQFLKEYCAGCQRFLFPAPRNAEALMYNSTFNLFWNRIRDKLAMIAPEAKELTPHYFRHNYATMHIMACNGVTISKAFIYKAFTKAIRH